MSDESAEYQAAVRALQDNYKAGIRAFAEWFAKNWQISPEEWAKSFGEPLPAEAWLKGYNAGVESVLGALDSFLGDYHP